MKPLQIIVLGVSFIIVHPDLYSQTIQRYVISCTGSTIGKNGKYYSHTVGQPSNTAIFSNQVYLYQGFQQPHKWNVNREKPENSIHIDVYPNPFNRYIHIKLDRREQALTLNIFDNQGKQVLVHKLNSAHSLIDTRMLPFGTYTLVIASGNKAIKYFHVLKLER